MFASKETKLLKYALYVRVSTDEQAQHGYSIEAQKEKCSAFVVSQDGQIYKTYVDEGYSGKNLKRAALTELLNDAKLKKFDLILVYKLDRFSRRLSDLVSLGEDLETIDIGIKSVTEPFDTTTPAGKLMFNMLGSFAQFERELIGERTKLGIMRRIKTGAWSTTRPFGYDLKDGELTINEAEAGFVRQCYKLVLEHNLGAELIARKFRKEDLVTGRKNKWAKNSVRTILTNPLYAGYIRWDGEVVKGKHKPIISKALLDSTLLRLKEKHIAPPWTGISPNIFTGLIFCVKCGSPLISSKPGYGTKKGKYRYYACKGRQAAKCDQDYIRADILEDSVFGKIKEISSEKDIISGWLEKNEQENSARLSECKKQKLQMHQNLGRLNMVKDKKVKWLLEYMPNKKVTQEVSGEIDKLLSQVEALKQKIETLDVEMQERNLEGVTVQIIGDFLKNFTDTFDKLDTGQKKVLIQSVVERIEVHSKSKVHVKLKIPIPSEKQKCESIPACDGEVVSFASLGILAPRRGLEPRT